MSRDSTTRRRFVQAVGMSSLAGIAGCLGDPDGADGDDDDGPVAPGGDDDTENGDPDEHPYYGSRDDAPDEVDAEFIHPSWDVPADMQWNQYNATRFVGDAAEMYFEEFTKYNIHQDERLPRGIADWSFGEEYIELEVWDELEWHDGGALTADDAHAHLLLQVEHYDHTLGDYLDEFEVVDETTLRLHTDGDINDDVLEELALAHWFHTPYSAFGEYVDRLEEGEDSADVSTDLAEWGPGPEEVPGLGPFEFVDRDESRMRQERVDEDQHPDADMINFPRVEYRHMPTNEDRWAALNTDEVSGVHTLFTEEEVVNEFPDNIAEVLPPGMWGLGLAFNHDHEHVGQREVRQAIAYSLDREIITEASAGPYAMKVDYPAAIVDAQTEWIEDVEDELDPYEYDPDRASELMEEAGYQMQDDVWVDEDGQPVELDVAVPAGFSDWLAGQQATNDLLNENGFQSELRSPDVSTYWGQVWPDGDFALASQGWTTGQPYPFFSLDWQLNSFDALEIMGVEEEITYEPIYEDGETTVQPGELLDQLARTDDEDEEREFIHELAAVVNQYLPMLPLQEKFDQTFLNVDEWRIDLPEDNPNAESIKWPQFWYGKQGLMWKTDE